jgi:hypothetical protein
MRRETDGCVIVLKDQMHDMMQEITMYGDSTHLSTMGLNQHRLQTIDTLEILKEIEERLTNRMKQVANDIEGCGNLCSMWTKKRTVGMPVTIHLSSVSDT